MVDDPLESHAGAVFRRVDFGHPVGFQLLDLFGNDNPAAAAEHLDVVGAAFFEQIQHVSEKLQVAALVA